MTATEPRARNCFRCPYCGGPVDRYEHHFECRGCGAIGDLVMGIMTRLVDLTAHARRWCCGRCDRHRHP